MASLMALTAASGLQATAADDAPIIEKPVVKVENGQFTPELLNALGRLSDPQLSPDGKRVLYGVSYPSVEQNKSNRELWVVDIDGKNARQLTHTKSSEQNAVWIDGGRRIAFIYPDADGNYQVWTMNADGTDRKQASSVKDGVDGFKLSDDQKKIVVISQVKYGETAQDVYPDLKKADGRIIDDLMYRHWDEWVSTVPHPFVGDFDGNAVTNLHDVLEGEPFESPMKPWGGVESLAWAPDGKSLVYVCRKKTGKEYAISTNSDLYLWDVASGKTVKNLTDGNLGYDTYPVFSKSGRKLAWLSMERDGYEADKNRIMVMDLATGVKQDITVNWDYTADAIAWSGLGLLNGHLELLGHGSLGNLLTGCCDGVHRCHLHSHVLTHLCVNFLVECYQSGKLLVEVVVACNGGSLKCLECAELHLLASDAAKLCDELGHFLAVDGKLLELVESLHLRSDCSIKNLVGECHEFVVRSHEVGLALQSHNGTEATFGLGKCHALGSAAVLTLCSDGLSALANQLNCFVQIILSLDKCLLAIHETCSCKLAELLNVGYSNCHNFDFPY